MKELDEKEFDNIFYSEVIDSLKDIGLEQRHHSDAEGTWVIAFIVGLAVIMLASFLCAEFCKDFTNSVPAIIISIAFMFLVSSCFWFPFYIIKKQKKILGKIKNKVYNIILEKFDLKYSAVTKEIQKKYKQIFRQLNIPTQKFEIDDIISGEYIDLPFSIFDCGIGRKFKGIIVATKTNKKFTKEIFIKRKTIEDNIISFINTSGCQKTEFEDIEFNALFDVIAQDPIEARYLLTTTFMERLKKYQASTGYNINVIFSRRTYSDYNLFLFINTGENHFELSNEIRKNTKDLNEMSNSAQINIYEKNHYYNIYSEIKEILKIADALKLDQNIGM